MRKRAWAPAPYDYADVIAFKALAEGKADAAQQRRALDWLIWKAAGAYDETYYPTEQGGERDSAFAQGRRFVGLQVVKLVNMPGAAMETLRNGGRTTEQ